ncbi:MAG: coenzyme F430 synthase [Methanomicrobiaceae archaeon]|nr:coenzyme F430 synthase [Methanomicrobiaceae archaeon]
MNILVLDTIHGGGEIARRLISSGHTVDTVDIYRHAEGIDEAAALVRTYDCIIAPVHMDPDHPLLQRPGIPRITHHEAVGRILGRNAPRPMVEITGARGKTTTATALASLFEGAGVLHTSQGTVAYPGRALLWKRSITPASVIDAAAHAHDLGGWLIAEESLGVSGAGTVGVLTSGEDYPIAGGKRHALAEKKRLLSRCDAVVAAPGIAPWAGHVVSADTVASCAGDTCRYAGDGIEGSFANPLLHLDGYRTPLVTAAAAACCCGIDPAPLAGFRALEGRMSTHRTGEALIVDNANSGTNAATTIDAARYARILAPDRGIVLAIGLEAATVCEGFPEEAIREAVGRIGPVSVVLVGVTGAVGERLAAAGIPWEHCGTLQEARDRACARAGRESIVLSVKTWR